MSANRKRKKVKDSAILITVLSVLVVAVFLLLFSNPRFWFKNSIHEDAKKYSTRSCLVFYPDTENGKKVAKDMCHDADKNSAFDYSLIPYGDYYLVSYGNGYEYFIDAENKPLSINEVSDFGKKIIIDYLRYTIKKEQPEKYYNSKFLAGLNVDSINFDGATYDIKGQFLYCKLPDYGVDVYVPLKYMQTEIGMNFGYKDELYVKPTYIDHNHPIICLTFDDGPELWSYPEESSSTSIVDTLYKYDATATFYVVGYALEERDCWTDYQVYSFLTNSINNGNEYGSHTAGHEDLVDLDNASAIQRVINEPAEFMKDLVGYNMVTYRPPGGVFDDGVISAQPLPAILWNVDSEDWVSRDANEIYEKVLSTNFADGDVVLFHEIYEETAQAIEKIVPALIDKGCQLVTVKDMLTAENIDVSTLHYYYNLSPSPYYE